MTLNFPFLITFRIRRFQRTIWCSECEFVLTSMDVVDWCIPDVQLKIFSCEQKIVGRILKSHSSIVTRCVTVTYCTYLKTQVDFNSFLTGIKHLYSILFTEHHRMSPRLGTSLRFEWGWRLPDIESSYEWIE